MYLLRGARQLKESFRVKTIEIQPTVRRLHVFATIFWFSAVFASFMVSGSVSSYFEPETRTVVEISPSGVCRG